MESSMGREDAIGAKGREEEEEEEEEEAQELPSHKKVLWPCGIDELEQRIEVALRTAAE